MDTIRLNLAYTFREIDTLSGVVILWFLSPIWKEFHSKAKEFASKSRQIFLLWYTHFQKTRSVQETKQDVTKVVSLFKKWWKSVPKCINSP